MCLLYMLKGIDGTHLGGSVQGVSKLFLVRLDTKFLQWVVSGMCRNFCLIGENMMGRDEKMWFLFSCQFGMFRNFIN